ncbi:MAG: undecaprenyl-diphosphate phosphatase [Candidatus Latescibacteria bacterium]|nr:undecaprenyl-diphosphate phosphatase [Candidatus Latescibacterota bacterium]
MTIWEAALLGLVQGLSEFLPISSSGHLVLGQAILGVETGDITFEVLVHFGTLLAVVTALWGRVRSLVVGCVKGEKTAWRLAWMLALGSVPAAVVGLAFKDSVKSAFSSPTAACAWLLVTGTVLFTTRFARDRDRGIGIPETLLIGIAQAFAVLPGVSRSGMTISTGLWRGVDGREVAEFSFLLSLPVILGATAVKVGELSAQPPGWESLAPLLTGTVVAYLSGVLAIRWLFYLMGGRRLDRFAYYCWAVGLVGLVALLR